MANGDIEPQVPEIIRKIKWLWLYGVKNWRWVLPAALLLLIPIIVANVDLPSGWGDSPRNSRQELHSKGPTKARLQDAVSDFEFEGQETNIEEAKRLIVFLGANNVHQRDPYSVSGTFGNPESPSLNYEITIWKNTYNKSDTYGLRFGLADSTYWADKASYCEIKKSHNGQASFYNRL